MRGQHHGHAIALWTDGRGRSLGAGACTGRFKSSYSREEGGECVEGAVDVVAVHVRDAEHVRECGPVLRVGPAAWAALLEARGARGCCEPPVHRPSAGDPPGPGPIAF
ncbi:DUF397 domain-containing protein [Streptomyces viridosporus]|uniref:DUF397 domain-containing protein n=1 Tax=Streptomyces viridosporus TaxID=67581 RepID=UPI003702366C